ncbi:hypothetical protein TNCV_3276411 [Trichonephila clavipes]|nr:hypothetical protein TNCV_3276411 [Trichonephila clavipes]
MRRKRSYALRGLDTRDERKARRDGETRALKRRARGITGENRERPLVSDKRTRRGIYPVTAFSESKRD